MRFDLSTLYFLAIGTLALSAVMTLLERHARPLRRNELGILAAGYSALAAGCALAMGRTMFAGPLGASLANMVMMGGYLLIFQGVARLAGRKRGAISLAIFAFQALIWIAMGECCRDIIWNYISAFPIALVSGLTAWELWTNDRFRFLRSRRVALAFAAMHSLFYIGRAFVLPLAVPGFGPRLLGISSVFTMYEGVLYSVGLPMALMALLREETQDQLLQASRTDYLTGLGNRRWFFEEADSHIRNANADARTFLLAFDLDHFKAINDRFGHATGDRVLKLFAGFVRGIVGPAAILTRIGGEEFAALLTCKSHAEAAAIAQGVVSGFAEIVIDRENGVDVTATVSIGLAELGRDGNDLADLLSAADAALYRAKIGGRNRIEPAEPPAPDRTACGLEMRA
ncbi:diguanylate cyclase (GGDEF)-like protein [Novosphingobium sp. PhB165]|uniref:GGDEF domain-containing protein n=1 Tax=Novosphingobium sp. PhB165 TaxID=2485105 RepID=UPI0010484751|nr:GGDEF domain-containing protein [Novosphingobium sp. PhB165]TCM16030.1 diguanylate cyclase (GGDEF)-like protein [Novosphingobium sp. PhB165]